jgi:rRNA maturation endonuclease Nob1
MPGTCVSCLEFYSYYNLNFCPVCGEELVLKCPYCEEDIEAWYTYCGYCKNDL